jgi:hypothetical protein
MGEKCIAKQSLRWVLEDARKSRRPRANWIETVNKDLENIGLSWQEAETTT